MSPRRAWPASVGATLVSCAVLASPVAAETLVPTRLDDPPPNGCKPQNCSLREAAIAANESGGSTTIRLGAGTYRLEQAGDDAAGGDVDLINSSATVLGEGSDSTRVSGESFTRVFEVGVGRRVSRPTFRMRGMTLVDGFSGEDGGGLLIGFSKTVLRGLAVRSSQALRGGGVAAAGATFTIKDSTFAGNVASYGGGLFAPAAFNPTEGVVRGSTFSGNDAGSGGGISMDGLNSPGAQQEPELRVVNSTLAGNHASNTGGGVSTLNGALLGLDNSTVAYNEASLQGSSGNGGGIRQLGTSAIDIGDSLVAANTVGSGGSGPQCAGNLEPNSGNLFQTPPDSACSYFGTNAANALIGPLEDNGGPTKTVKLLTGSPAIALAESCPAKDQRGKLRPATDCDSGAFERNGP